MTAFVNNSGSYKNMTATGAVTTSPTAVISFYVNSTSSGVIQFRDGGASGVGTAIGGQITPSIGAHLYPVAVGSGGLHMTLVSGSIDITVFFQSLANP